MESIEKLAQKYTHREMIVKHTTLPPFPHYRSELLHCVLKHDQQQDHKLYTLVTALVQLGMDSHDMVDVEEKSSSLKQMRKQQLHVLTGDYLSSKFYQLLSQAGKIGMVKQFSQAICEVNRLKIIWYEKLKSLQYTGEQALQDMIDIRMQLYIPCYQLLQDVTEKDWMKLLRGFTACEVLHNEIKEIKHQTLLQDSFAYRYVLEQGENWQETSVFTTDQWKRFDEQYNVNFCLEQKLKQQWSKLKQDIVQLEDDKLVKPLLSLGQSFASHS
ncbi:heptaprenyl diphosphate synthase component 1 [Longirhabdus pacifica]|uniref:heptaprenyl diphosphate synthase component 1 n=1 Tax=Longirhabdus pacifica TaxID=2305227 RepID=UPI001008C468|nr:heptaprenyl diphosphate synthase component 1 [Longirhabdus pacifica]